MFLSVQTNTATPGKWWLVYSQPTIELTAVFITRCSALAVGIRRNYTEYILADIYANNS